MQWKNILTVLFLILPLGNPIFAQSERPPLKEVVDFLDKVFRADSSEALMTMTIETPNWKRELEMRIWSKGMDQTFIYITSPQKDAGIATLRMKTEMWNYFPKINKVMKVPPSMMMSSWMGSDFTNDDLVKETTFINDYDFAYLNEPASDTDHYYIQLIPKQDTASVWGQIVVTLRKADWIPVRQEYYDETGTKMRVMELKEIRKFGNRTIPATLEMTPLNKAGHKTTVQYKEAVFDLPVGEEVFSLRNLQKRRQ